MKVNELMIGDWVYVKDYPMKPEAKKVTANHFMRSLCEYEPIPLTEEVLKANEFWEEGGGFAKFFPNVGKFTTWKSRIEDIQCTLLGTIELPLRYVHELQHALRLCGLNDLADNFKV